MRRVGDPGQGCSSDLYRQFNTGAFAGPLVGSVGLESGNNYLKGCFASVLDLSVARNIRLPGPQHSAAGRHVQRVNRAGITGRNTTDEPGDPNVQPAFDPIPAAERRRNLTLTAL